MDSDFDFEGAGDRREHRSPGSDTTPYIKRRFANGLPIPVFPTRGANDHSEDLQGAHVPPAASPSLVNVLKEYLCCPVCKDTCIETTAANCGHKFCKECLNELQRQKPLCPICSTFITSHHRLYSDDLFVESQLPYLRPEFRRRFELARSVRLEKLMKANNGSMMKSVRRKLDNSLVYLKCKNSFNLATKIRSTSYSLFEKIYEWNHAFDRKLAFGILLGMLLTMMYFGLFGRFVDFWQYTWLAWKNYNGTIPEDWLKQMLRHESVDVPLQFPSVSSILKRAIDTTEVVWEPFFYLFDKNK